MPFSLEPGHASPPPAFGPAGLGAARGWPQPWRSTLPRLQDLARPDALRQALFGSALVVEARLEDAVSQPADFLPDVDAALTAALEELATRGADPVAPARRARAGHVGALDHRPRANWILELPFLGADGVRLLELGVEELRFGAGAEDLRVFALAFSLPLDDTETLHARLAFHGQALSADLWTRRAALRARVALALHALPPTLEAAGLRCASLRCDDQRARLLGGSTGRAAAGGTEESAALPALAIGLRGGPGSRLSGCGPGTLGTALLRAAEARGLSRAGHPALLERLALLELGRRVPATFHHALASFVALVQGLQEPGPQPV